MSRLLRERFTAVVGPDRVVLARRAGWRGAPQLHSQAECEAPTAKVAIAALAGLLARPEVGRGDLTIVLSNHFVQYVLLPWRAEVGRPSEQAAYAGILFDETFGSDSGGREILIGRERSGSARIAAGVESTLLHGLRNAVAASRLKLVSVQPYLSAAFDRVRGSVGSRDFMFVLAEPARSCVLVASGGRWRSLRSTASGARPHELAHLIEREAQLAGLADEGMPPVFVHAPGNDALKVPPCQGVTPRTIGLSQRADDPFLAMALTVN
ncbi:hypothetical protein [Ramlibacter alkalitolerans]|uniref:Uncharacterized protein n=1 Tax=Ramlibacter alkalitolerans TaxID=2039631 RepID=A0ABS1JH49_9BURK|nr:hypothetical protein [Ramlibacter alkalitolerans]MBL0423544.1 hypothetical protein [Ramlibacter alkalitolerans]